MRKSGIITKKDAGQDRTGEKTLPDRIRFRCGQIFKPENVSDILDILEPHFPKIPRITGRPIFRSRNEALKALRGIL